MCRLSPNRTVKTYQAKRAQDVESQHGGKRKDESRDAQGASRMAKPMITIETS